MSCASGDGGSLQLLRIIQLNAAGKLLGYTRTGTVVVPLLTAALEQLAAANRIVRDANGNWTLTQSGEAEAAEHF